MSSANVDPPIFHSPGTRSVPFLIVLAVALLLVTSLEPNMDRFGRTAASDEVADLTLSPQEGADRMADLAEARTMGEVLRSVQAEQDRWEALAEYYRQRRAKQAETDRLTGLAEQQGLVAP